MTQLTRTLHHVAIEVDDLDGAIAWYGDYLGFRFERRFELPDAGISIAYMTSAALRIELLRRGTEREMPRRPAARESSGGDSPEGGSSGSANKPARDDTRDERSISSATRTREEFRPSMHICFEVDDIELAADELRRRGVEFAQEPKLIPAARVKNLWIRAFEGHLIEFLEPVG